jgi:DNA-damage-inducible protein D
MENQLIVFEENRIRKVEHNGEWWFSVVDIIAVLTDSSQANRYWADLKKRSSTESNQPFAFCEQLKMTASDGKQRLTDAANTEGILRITMSVPSPKAEPLKLWLAQVGTQQLAETENPELGFERLRDIYRAKGYPNEWIQQRLKTIEVRKELTDEWQQRGIKEGQEYSILTATIAKGTFGLTPSEHRDLKGLTESKHNLRDNMTNLELIFTALGEEISRSLTIENEVQGFNEAHEAAQKGGSIAGDARRKVEERGQKVISSQNFINQSETEALPDSENPTPQ